jgi:hypothetical protein
MAGLLGEVIPKPNSCLYPNHRMTWVSEHLAIGLLLEKCRVAHTARQPDFQNASLRMTIDPREMSSNEISWFFPPTHCP